MCFACFIVGGIFAVLFLILMGIFLVGGNKHGDI